MKMELITFYLLHLFPFSDSDMAPLITIAEKLFYNIRGSFKIFGFIDIGTHASLIRLKEPTESDPSPHWALIDSINFSDEQVDEIRSLTNDGRDIDVIINVHPFHTVYTPKSPALFPSAKLYGTERHKAKHPSLPWEPIPVESAEFPQEFSKYSSDFEFSVPQGVDFVPTNENIHFSSVLVYHKPTKTVFSDDTFGSMRLPYLATWLGYEQHGVSLHPTLGSALQRRVGAAGEFRSWLTDLLERWDIQNLVAAHNSNFLAKHVEADPAKRSIKTRLLASLESWEPTLQAHEEKAQQKAQQKAKEEERQE